MIKLLDDAEKAIATLMLEVNRLNDELELVKKELALQKLSDISQEIENEPSVQKSEMSTLRELTDEEILDTFDPHFDADIKDKELIKFARAILKKASEK